MSRSGAFADSSPSIALAERGWLPDAVLRWGIRRHLVDRLAELESGGSRSVAARRRAFVAELRRSPIALAPDAANRQHYEVPAAFFRQVLGPRMKYSCAWFDADGDALAAAEEAMLERTCQRAGIADGMEVLDLGCGWGALSVFIAERFPRCRVWAVSNAKAQREHLLAECAARGLTRVEAQTADVNAFDPGRRFDRVVSVEMFEHLRNWPRMLERIAGWLRPDGRLFLHFFSHRAHAYPYEDRGRGDWMARNFFSGGMMPSHDLIRSFDEHLRVEAQWRLDGEHYRRTCQAWLRNLDLRQAECLALLGPDPVRAWRSWRLFFLACAELFGFRDGAEWGVSHVRLAPLAG